MHFQKDTNILYLLITEWGGSGFSSLGIVNRNIQVTVITYRERDRGKSSRKFLSVNNPSESMINSAVSTISNFQKKKSEISI